MQHILGWVQSELSDARFEPPIQLVFAERLPPAEAVGQLQHEVVVGDVLAAAAHVDQLVEAGHRAQRVT